MLTGFLEWTVLAICFVYLLGVLLIAVLVALPCLGLGVHRVAQRGVLVLSVQMVTRVAVLLTFVVAPPDESTDVARGIVFNMLNDVPDLCFYIALLLVWASLSDEVLGKGDRATRALAFLPIGAYTVLSFVACIVEIGDDAVTVPETVREDIAVAFFCLYDVAIASLMLHTLWRLRGMER
tara:strand:- start:95 stop:634 length:540 start_codon:yes stop_codon:yes gene_type:complete